MVTLIKNVKVVYEHAIEAGLDVLLTGDTIASIGKNLPIGENTVIHEGNGSYLCPGFIDIHVHGGGGSDFMDASEADFDIITKYHAASGTTAMLATTLTSSDEELLETIKCYNGYVKQPHCGTQLLGLHLEGPYFSYEQRGAQDPKHLVEPKRTHYERILQATPHIRRWSAAPELIGISDFAAACVTKNIVLSIGHSSCDAETAHNALKDGFNLITHFYSGMNGVMRKNCYRVAGLVEAGYLYDDFKIELIADGRHLPSEILSLVLKVKGEKNIALITDCSSASGSTARRAKIGSRKSGLDAFVENGVAFLADRSAFAGSIATTDRLLETMLTLTPASIPQAVRMLTLTPAEILGIDNQKGKVAKGYDADLVLFDYNNQQVKIKNVYIRGKKFN